MADQGDAEDEAALAARWAAFFLGAWRVERRMEDHLAGEILDFEGRAELRSDGDGRHLFLESGRLRRGEISLPAEQRYVWRFGPGALARIHFADDRPFCDFALAGPGAPDSAARHLCGADLYRGALRVEGPDSWRLEWRVSGPKKGYRSLSRYQRAPEKF